MFKRSQGPCKPLNLHACMETWNIAVLIVIKESGTFIHKHCCNSNHQPHTVKKCSQYRGTSDNMDEVNLTLSPASAIAASQEPWHSSFSIVTQLYFD
ncbi:hypothetical protein OUZ56_011046 [Daphnia magna]|uniref:Uncharacterized protein n=1 Tax=Daphnia magna TaxID=35525 RepID=A0ABQ9YZ41_9CRUS|nr:hypothetical protein OUZ56_011046 [Daphnia magna]